MEVKTVVGSRLNKAELANPDMLEVLRESEGERKMEYAFGTSVHDTVMATLDS